MNSNNNSNSNRGQLYILSGPARSGKSTIANRWVRGHIDFMKTSNNINLGCIVTRIENYGTLTIPRAIVCADNIRLSMGHRYNSYVESYVDAVKHTMVDSLLQRKIDVIVDGTSTTKNSLRKLFEIDINAVVVFVNTDVEVCKQRAKETNQEDLYPVIDRQYKQYLELKKLVYENNLLDTIKSEVLESQKLSRIVD